MPIYFMECPKCGHQEDKLLFQGDLDAMKDGVYPTVKCSECAESMKKTDTLFGANLSFKGDWFATKGKY